MSKTLIVSAADQTRISAAIAEAEANTSGEIVPIIADHSDRYLDVALWWSVLAGVLALAALAAFPSFYLEIFNQIFSSGWASEETSAEILELALAVFIIKFVSMRLLLQWRWLRMALTPGIVKTRRVRRRAIHHFKVAAEARTAGKTGILIYLSLVEHRAEIIADAAIHAAVGHEPWGEAMSKMVAEVREGRIADGMIAAVGDVGLILAQHLPRSVDDVNELPDRLIEL